MKTIKKFKKRKVYRDCMVYMSNEDIYTVAYGNCTPDECYMFNGEYDNYDMNIVENESGIEYIDIDKYVENPVYVEEYNYRFYLNTKYNEIQ